jgi:hypothetical protein
MDFIKETILTFSQKDKEEFDRFLTRKQQKKDRKDLDVFQKLFDTYSKNSDDLKAFKGDQNYHAIRKRLIKELENYLVLKHSYNENNLETSLLMINHFIALKRYEIAWELLEKEETKVSRVRNFELGLRIQRMKLDIMPYYGGEFFEVTKQKMLKLQQQQAKADKIQLTFIQIQNALKSKIHKSSTESTQLMIDDVFNEYALKDILDQDPLIYLKIIETVRAKYLMDKKYKLFAGVAQDYYNKLIDTFNYEELDVNIAAQLEYIMAHAYFRVRNFKSSSKHLQRLESLMKKNEVVFKNYSPRYISLKSSIDIFEGNLKEAIDEHRQFLDNSAIKLSLKDQLNLSLNLVGYYCCEESFSKANKILLYVNQSDNFYQNHMGREWLVRKDLVRVLVQVELGNIEIAIRILESLKQKHADMFSSEQYGMVKIYINTLLMYLKDPYQTSLEVIADMEKKTNFKDERLYDDPKLLAFYAWLKSKITKKNLYQSMLQEYNLLGSENN